ncbi:MAG: alanine racemase [Actinomycetota bacterium]|nr:alanine racemase [Actinomycetota bacterium]
MSPVGNSLSSQVASAYGDIVARGLRSTNGRPFEVIGVTKTFAVEIVQAGYEAGIRSFGENYADELISKASHSSLIFADDPIKWHFVGAIQSKKISKLAEHVSVWHSVAREKEIERIAEVSPNAEIFIQVNFSDALQRNGVRPPDAEGLVNLGREAGLQVIGLMVVPPIVNQDLLGKIFTAVNDERLRLGLRGCSMGMSDDFELALAKGSTHIRVGRALFGNRGSTGMLGSNIGQGGPG